MRLSINPLVKNAAKKLPKIAQKTERLALKTLGFKNEQEIVQYFKKIGIDVRIEDFSPTHLETFNLIREDVKILKAMGLQDSLPEVICLSDWRNIEKTKKLLSEYGLNISFPPNRRAFCGMPANIIFINGSEEAQKSSNGIFRKFKHEIGHRCHYTHRIAIGKFCSNGAKSVLGKGVKNDIDFANRQLQILGIKGSVGKIKGYTVPNITLPYEDKFIAVQTAYGPRLLSVDLSRAVAYMNEKCHCYNKKFYSEQVAEIFEDLLKGRQFDDLTMLMYDFAGGGRIPNLIINGQKYDNYIKSLYENKELTDKLRQFILIS